jgi:PAS domain-containing protein
VTIWCRSRCWARRSSTCLWPCSSSRRTAPASPRTAACELTGYERAELLALAPEALSGRSARELERKQRDFARRGRAPGRGPLRRKDGTVVDVDYRWLPTRVADMEFYVFLVTPQGTPLFDVKGA